MSSENNNLLKDLLRVITPNEINELTTKSDGDNLAPLSEYLLDQLEEFDWRDRHGEEEEFKKKVSFRAGKSASKLFRFVGLTNTKTIVILLDDKEDKAKEQEYKSKESRGNENDFLDIKDKLHIAYRKTKGKEVMNLYQNYAAIDIKQLKTTKDDLKKSAHAGNLINKRQA